MTVVKSVPNALTSLSLKQLWQQLDANLSSPIIDPKQQADYLELSANQCADAFKTEAHRLAEESILNFHDDDETCSAEARKQRHLQQQAIIVLKRIGEGLEVLNHDHSTIAREAFQRIKTHPTLARFYPSKT